MKVMEMNADNFPMKWEVTLDSGVKVIVIAKDKEHAKELVGCRYGGDYKEWTCEVYNGDREAEITQEIIDGDLRYESEVYERMDIEQTLQEQAEGRIDQAETDRQLKEIDDRYHRIPPATNLFDEPSDPGEPRT